MWSHLLVSRECGGELSWTAGKQRVRRGELSRAATGQWAQRWNSRELLRSSECGGLSSHKPRRSGEASSHELPLGSECRDGTLAICYGAVSVEG